jgi:hypothetical protein
MILGPSDVERLKVGGVRARVVGSILMTPECAKQISETLAGIVKTYEQRRTSGESDSD